MFSGRLNSGPRVRAMPIMGVTVQAFIPMEATESTIDTKPKCDPKIMSRTCSACRLGGDDKGDIMSKA